MTVQGISRPARLALTGLGLLVASCAPPTANSNQAALGREPAQAQPAAATKVVTLGISTPPTVFSILMSSGDPTGGWTQVTELHTDGLITSEPSSRRPVGRLAENVPTVDDGTVS